MLLNLKKENNKNKGFTLIELLFVIAIIGILSSVVLASLGSARNNSKYARTQAELRNFIKIIEIARGESSKTLLEITGSGCSRCACSGDLRNISDTSTCYLNWVNVLTKVQTASDGIVSGLDRLKRDPWGSPYLLDENEGEGGNCARIDNIRTAGPDGFYGTSDDQAYNILRSIVYCP